MFVDEPNMIWQCLPKTIHIPGCIKRSVGGRSRKVTPGAQLCSYERAPGGLCPPLRPPTEEKHGPAKESPGEGDKDDPRARVYLLYRQVEEVEVVLPGKEKALSDLRQLSRI